MLAPHTPELGRTHRSVEEIVADADAAEAFWAGLEQLDDVRRAALFREAALSDPLMTAVAEAAAWNRRYSTRRAQATAGRGSRGLDHLTPDIGRRRAHVDEQTAAQMPSPRLWNRNTWVGREQERHDRQLWRKRIESPSPRLRHRLEAEGKAIANEVARAHLLADGSLVAPEDLRLQRLDRLTRRNYFRGKVNPVGMNYQRAMDIAIACLNREAELSGVPRPRPLVLDGAMSAPRLSV